MAPQRILVERVAAKLAWLYWWRVHAAMLPVLQS